MQGSSVSWTASWASGHLPLWPVDSSQAARGVGFPGRRHRQRSIAMRFPAAAIPVASGARVEVCWK